MRTIHKEKVIIPASEYNRINSLLAIISLEEMTDDELLKIGANTDYYEGIFNITFKWKSCFEGGYLANFQKIK